MKCSRTARGENPFRRKWNPRIAAQQRRERELQQKMRPEPNAASRIPDAAKAQEEKGELPRKAERDEVKHCSHEDPMAAEYGSTSKAGFTLSTPLERGPELQPGEKERQRIAAPVAAANAIEAASLDSVTKGRSHSGQATVAAPSSSMRSYATGDRESSSRPFEASRMTLQQAVEQDPNSLEGMDFKQLQKLISAGIASAEVDQAFDGLDVDTLPSASRTLAPPPPRETASVRARGAEQVPSRPRGESPRAAASRIRSPAHAEEEMAGAADAGASSGAGLSLGSAPEPPRRMAGVRAAAERRAYQAAPVDEQDSGMMQKTIAQQEDFEDEPCNSLAETTMRPVSDIRAIAERRGAGFRSRTPGTPRAVTPRAVTPTGTKYGPGGDAEQDREGATRTPTPRGGGVYKPNHLYSGRSTGIGERSGGERLATSLGLRYGQPPPDH